jgi:hypothetical protein
MRFAAAVLAFGLFWLLPGASSARASTVFAFEGELDWREGSLGLALRGEGLPLLVLEARGLGSSRLSLDGDIRHMKAGGYDLAGRLALDLILDKDTGTESRLTGRLSGYDMMVNSFPVRDLRAVFVVRGKQLDLEEFSCGVLSAKGTIDLAENSTEGFFVELLPVELEHVCRIAGLGSGLPLAGVTGTVAANLQVSGALRVPRIQGRLSAANGSFGALFYDSIGLQFVGTYPQLELLESLVVPAGRAGVRISGRLDFSDWHNLGAQAARLRRSPVVSEERDRRGWVLQRMQTEDNSVTELKYLLLKDDRGDASAFLGIQKSIGF